MYRTVLLNVIFTKCEIDYIYVYVFRNKQHERDFKKLKVKERPWIHLVISIFTASFPSVAMRPDRPNMY